MAEKKEYKWQVRPGGTFDGNALNIKSATAQAGAVSQHKSLGINKGGDSAPALDHQSLGVAHAMSAPKPPSTVNAVDKTTSVRNNSSGL